MKKFFSFLLKFIGIISAIAAISYCIYRFFYASKHRTTLTFHKDFTDEEDNPQEKVTLEKESENHACASKTCPESDAVCAVDMCMPY